MLTNQRKKSFKAVNDSDTTKVKKIDRIQKIADITLKIISSIAIVVTGSWAYYQYYLKGADGWVTNIALTTEVLPYDEKSRLLVVHIKSKNPTAATLDIEQETGSFDLTVRKLPNGLKEGNSFDETSGKEIAKINLLADDLEMLPNAEFDNIETIIVPVGAILSITAEMKNENGSFTEDGKPDHDFVNASTVVHIDDKKSN